MFWQQVSPSTAQSPEQTRRRFEVMELEEPAMLEASVLNILNSGLGFRKSAERGACVLGNGQAIPMMSYGLIEYLMDIDLSKFELLELGGGYSTEFWSARVRSVVTLETDSEWAQTLSGRNWPNVAIRSSSADSLANDMLSLGQMFDAIIVDASANRYRCAKAALQILKPGGFILLDNADWYPNTTRLLRGADLIQVDFHDFRPLRWYRCVTSLFLHKEFRAKPRFGALPAPAIGGKDIAGMNDWDKIVD